jgi:hypothetical protein
MALHKFGVSYAKLCFKICTTKKGTVSKFPEFMKLLT